MFLGNVHNVWVRSVERLCIKSFVGSFIFKPDDVVRWPQHWEEEQPSESCDKDLQQNSKGAGVINDLLPPAAQTVWTLTLRETAPKINKNIYKKSFI